MQEQQKDVSMTSVSKYQALKCTTELVLSIFCSRRDLYWIEELSALLPVPVFSSPRQTQPVVLMIKQEQWHSGPWLKSRAWLCWVRWKVQLAQDPPQTAEALRKAYACPFHPALLPQDTFPPAIYSRGMSWARNFIFRINRPWRLFPL